MAVCQTVPDVAKRACAARHRRPTVRNVRAPTVPVRCGWRIPRRESFVPIAWILQKVPDVAERAEGARRMHNMQKMQNVPGTGATERAEGARHRRRCRTPSRCRTWCRDEGSARNYGRRGAFSNSRRYCAMQRLNVEGLRLRCFAMSASVALPWLCGPCNPRSRPDHVAALRRPDQHRRLDAEAVTRRRYQRCELGRERC